MLTFFQVRHTYHNVQATLIADVEAGETSITVKVGGRIIALWVESHRMKPKLRTLAGCEAWASELVPVPGGEQGRLQAWHMFPACRPRMPEAA